MNQQAFSGGLAPPFLPMSLPSGVPTPSGHPVPHPHFPYGSLPNNTQVNSAAVGGTKEERSDRDQVSLLVCWLL